MFLDITFDTFLLGRFQETISELVDRSLGLIKPPEENVSDLDPSEPLSSVPHPDSGEEIIQNEMAIAQRSSAKASIDATIR